jgi:hypothetical protein
LWDGRSSIPRHAFQAAAVPYRYARDGGNSDLSKERLGSAATLYGTVALSFVIPRARDFFDLFVFSASNRLYFKPPNKAVILSEALRRSIANRELYSAESKDPGDACWQMLLGAFRPQTTTEDKNSQTPGKPRDLQFRGPFMEMFFDKA